MSDFVIKRPIDFDLEQTLECGQCFHFEKIAEQDYVLTAYNRALHIAQKDDELVFYNTDKSDFDNIWKMYFDLDRDYEAIKKELLKADPKLAEAIEAKWGVHLLNQSFFETLISFIISQNKQIPHIKKIVADISAKYGDLLYEDSSRKLYAFPSPKQLENVTVEDLKELKTGFRAPYIKDAIDRVLALEFSGTDEASFRAFFDKLSPEETIAELTKIKGVGLKVASCVSLFALNKREAFPIDVWIKRIMEAKYFDGKDTKIPVIEKFAKEKYKDLGGYAQQYLFYYARSLKINKL
ncbi:DNA-3-methyladenine glycosylase family protein [Lachnospira pectinoschiza]|uniref:DNA-(apurinic or apyrimidinic site) lyase n=1 Tax=Lachnospira pectinoschiza TaxID=28052 RepID=A0A1G9ZMB5_9FIRM|nr:DNA glycosylase [Lachnospira pectinoschiza]SDN22161.1 N-glycosylase/DNA lyase [Lachnospira pectinoschiza]